MSPKNIINRDNVFADRNPEEYSQGYPKTACSNGGIHPKTPIDHDGQQDWQDEDELICPVNCGQDKDAPCQKHCDEIHQMNDRWYVLLQGRSALSENQCGYDPAPSFSGKP